MKSAQHRVRVYDVDAKWIYFNLILEGIFLRFKSVRTLSITPGQKNFLKFCVVYHDHKLIILKMSDNVHFPQPFPSFYMNFPFAQPSQFFNFQEGQPLQMENLAYCHFYPAWFPNTEIQDKQDFTFEKSDENHGSSQTKVGSRSSEIFEKPKRTQAPRFRPTKNNESNICNQAYSFLTNESKSRTFLEKFFNNKRKVDAFYDLAKCLTLKRKKYMSKGSLLKLCNLNTGNLEISELQKSKIISALTVQEFEKGACFLIIYFLKHKSASSILTSQKIADNLKIDHISKVREILIFIEESLSARKDNAQLASSELTVKLQY